MDDMKREIYIRAKARIASREHVFICYALRDELIETFTTKQGCRPFNMPEYDSFLTQSVKDLLEEFFPEFYEMFDGFYWSDFADGEVLRRRRDSHHEAWFNFTDRERRYRLLDFLITHR